MKNVQCAGSVQNEGIKSRLEVSNDFPQEIIDNAMKKMDRRVKIVVGISRKLSLQRAESMCNNPGAGT